MKNNAENKQVNPFSLMEEDVLKFWEKSKTFEKSVEKDAPQGDYVFYDGPPFATGLPHYGHIVASIIKDVVPRYQTMKGYKVERKWGWDCHGLPIENIVEKEFGSKSKKDIEELGVDKFNEMCRSKVLSYVDDWKVVIRKLGRWADMENAYKTMDLSFMESVWAVFKKMYDNDLIYEGHRSMHICPRCETTLSQSEVTEGYKDVKDLSATAKFELLDEPGTFVLAWTTTPWTLIGNVALAVGSSVRYKEFTIISSPNLTLKEGDKYIVSEDYYNELFLNQAFAEGATGSGPLAAGKTVIEHKTKFFEGTVVNNVREVDARDLIGKKYKPLFDYYAGNENLENRENGWQIYAGDFVTTEEGTGVVHIAPAFGEDDMRLGQEHNLPFVQHVGMDGNFRPEVTDFTGMNVKPIDNHMATDIEIIKYLAHNNLLFHKEKYEHSYPHCWRCDTPLLNYATGSWFVNVTKIKDELLKNAEDINWSPEHIKKGRWGNWLEGARDWSISRQRFWASVMPIWECDHQSKVESGKSKVDCNNRVVVGSVDELEKLSGQKVTDIHKHVVDDITFKCSECGGTMRRIPDVLDTWFDSGSMPYAQMHYPFENKEKFESNFPAEFIAEGADQTRCWFYYLHILGTGTRQTRAFNNVIVNGIVLAEDGKKMSKKLQNYPDPMDVFDKYGADALRYYLLTSPVMLADNLNFAEKGVQESLRKVNMILWNVVKFYELFAEGEGEIEANCESENVLDQWIVARLNQLIETVTREMDAYNLPRASRPIVEFIDDLSTWYVRRSRDRFKGGDAADKKCALATTKYVLLEVSKVMAPFTPFIAEQVWQKISGNDFGNEGMSVHLEEWPLLREGYAGQAEVLENMAKVRDIVELGLAKRDESNIKVRQPLNELRVTSSTLHEDYVALILDEVNVKNIKFTEGDELSVELDTKITEELNMEGMKREMVRFVNALRKNAGLSINDRVVIYFDTSVEIVKKTVEKFKNDIMQDTLANDMVEGVSDDIEFKKDVKVNGEEMVLGVEQK